MACVGYSIWVSGLRGYPVIHVLGVPTRVALRIASWVIVWSPGGCRLVPSWVLRGASRHGSFRLLGWVTFPFFSCSVPPAFRWWLVRLCAPSRIIPHFPDVIGVVLPGWFSWIALYSRFISSRSCSDLPCVSVLVPPGCPCWWRVFPSFCPVFVSRLPF